jgi:rhamnosyltransferase
MNKAPQVAIIMRSKNEQPYIRDTLERFSRQTFTDYVLYNVDSGSTDGTLDVVRQHNPRPENVVEIASEAYVPGPVLNTMIEKTTEPIIVLLNADAIPLDDHWLERLLAPIVAGEADATMSRQVVRGSARFIDQYDYERAYSEKNLERDADFFSAVACAFRRKLWEDTKFYTDGYAEDLAWCKACREKGARFRIVTDSVVEHSHNYSIRGLYGKRYRHGIAYVHIHNERPRFFRQCVQCVREIARDLLHALRKGRLDTVPYNVLHRVVIHLAYYRGEREGRRQQESNRKGGKT